MLFKSVLSLTVLIILGLTIALFILHAVMPGKLSAKFSKQLQVAVTIGDIDTGLTALGVNKVEISNPAGSTLPKALSAKNITVSAPVTRYFDQHIVIDEISVSDIYLGLEFDSPSGTKGNWTQIMSNYENTPEPAKDTDRSVLIKRLVLNNISVELVYRTASGKIKRLPLIRQIVLTNISSTGGVPMDQIAGSILGQMLKSIFMKENLKNMLEGIVKNPAGTAKDIIKMPFKGIFK